MGAWIGSRRTLALAALVSVVVIAAGTLIASPVAPERPALATRLASLHTGVIAVRRAPFCSAVRRIDLEAALGSPVATTTSWRNGATADLDGDASTKDSDVVDEFGCRWRAGEASAAAWVFAPPVTVARAGRLADSARTAKGCAPIVGAAAFGSPSVAIRCAPEGADSDVTEYRYAGLFGDAWLTCSLTGIPSGRADLADRFCAAVLLAAS